MLKNPKGAIAYKKIGDGMMCETGRKSVYTFSLTHGCDGWQYISLADCKAKCTRNELPNSRCPRQGVKCAYVIYSPQTTDQKEWCYLADETCNPIKAEKDSSIFKKQGLYTAIKL